MRLRQRLASPLFTMNCLEWLMDAIAFTALLVTQEVKLWTWAATFALIALRLTLKFRLSTPLFTTGFATLLTLTLFFAFGSGMHPLVAIVQTVPILHSLIILSRDGNRYQGWRIGVAFTEIILASAITPDFTLPLLVFLFVMTAIALASCNFVLRESVRSGASASAFELPQGFSSLVAKQAFVILLAGLLIFPILPRVSRDGGGGTSVSTHATGYTEEVTLNEWVKMTSEGSSATALRILASDNTDFSEFIFSGLLRSRILNRFDGESWKPTPGQDNDPPSEATVRGPGKVLTFHREAFGAPSLPIPYAATKVMVEHDGVPWLAARTRLHELVENRHMNRRVNYQVHLPLDPGQYRAALPIPDSPTQIDLEVPESLEKTRIRRLATNLFRNSKTTKQKVEAVFNMIVGQRFAAGDELSETSKALYDRNLSPLENFMFRTREGHCELFSSMMAVLLRMSGVPARVVAGFRVSRFPVGKVMTVRMADAHAWVEVYYAGQGWVPIDPTPKVLVEPGFSDWVRDGYDWLSANWNLYILSYGEGTNVIGEIIRSFQKSLEEWGSEAKSGGEKSFSLKDSWQLPLALFVAVVLIALMFITRQRSQKRMHLGWEGRPRLRRERRRFEKALARRKRLPDAPSDAEVQWRRRYQELRFSRAVDPSTAEVRELRELTRKVGTGKSL